MMMMMMLVMIDDDHKEKHTLPNVIISPTHPPSPKWKLPESHDPSTDVMLLLPSSTSMTAAPNPRSPYAEIISQQWSQLLMEGGNRKGFALGRAISV